MVSASAAKPAVVGFASATRTTNSNLPPQPDDAGSRGDVLSWVGTSPDQIAPPTGALSQRDA